MQKKSLLFLLFFPIIFSLKASVAFSYACSHHDSVDCESGADNDGSVICADGWADSEVLYEDVKEECGDKYVEHKKYFSDIGGGHKNYKAVIYLADIGVIDGYADETFQPEKEINRAEFIKILVEGSGHKPKVETYNNCFDDVDDQWFAPYACFAKSIGWINGYPDGTYKPAQTVNKVEAVKMVLNSQKIEVPESIDQSPFDDVALDDWFAPYVKVAKDMGILEETGNLLNGAENMKRSSVCENLYRTIRYEEPVDEEIEKDEIENGFYVVDRIIDGDTIELSNGEKVRLLGIDTPEKNEDYYDDASEYLRGLIGENRVELESDELNEDKDVYGRLLRYIYVDDELLNLEMVKKGWAKYYKSFPISKAEEFARAEKNAQDAGLGIWM